MTGSEHAQHGVRPDRHGGTGGVEEPRDGDGVRVVELYAEEQVRSRVAELAAQISGDAAGELVVVGILKGAFVFMADLVRQLSVPCRCDFLALQSYGARSTSSGAPRLAHDLMLPLTGRDVLVVEDIVDTGSSLRAALDRIQRERPRSVRTCVLLDKPSRRTIEVPLDYVGFTVPDRFVVGCGIDWDERFRNLPFIGYVEGV